MKIFSSGGRHACYFTYPISEVPPSPSGPAPELVELMEVEEVETWERNVSCTAQVLLSLMVPKTHHNEDCTVDFTKSPINLYQYS